MSVHQRFYLAMALDDLVNEVPLPVVCQKYGINKGMLQDLQHRSSIYAGMLTSFCAKLGWNNLELLLGQFGERLEFCVQRELIDLVRLTSLNGQRARVLFNGGIESVAELANTLPADVENLLHNCAPFESKNQNDGETALDAAKRTKMRSLWVTGRKGEVFLSASRVLRLRRNTHWQ